jgi:hypothetical protein
MSETPTDRDLLKLCDVVENYDPTALPSFVLRLAAAVRRLLAEKAALEAELAQARGAALTPAASPPPLTPAALPRRPGKRRRRP